MDALLSQKLKMKEDEAKIASSSVFVLPATRFSLNAIDLASEQAGATETQKRAEHACVRERSREEKGGATEWISPAFRRKAGRRIWNPRRRRRALAAIRLRLSPYLNAPNPFPLLFSLF